MEAILVTLITTIGMVVQTIITKRTNKKVDTINEIKEDLKKEIKESRESNKKEMDKHILEADKTYLTNFLSEIENGMVKSEIQIKRAYEIYEEYRSKNGNSYIHDKWEELRGKGLIWQVILIKNKKT